MEKRHRMHLGGAGEECVGMGVGGGRGSVCVGWGVGVGVGRGGGLQG